MDITRRSLLLSSTAAATALCAGSTSSARAATADTVVDFGRVVERTTPYALGIGCSTYGATPLTSSVQAAAERRLDARHVRIPVRWDGQRVVSSAGGSSLRDVSALVERYRSWGYRCLVVIAGRTNDWDGYQSGDAQKIVRALGTDMVEYSGPNESNNQGKTIAQFVSRAQQVQKELSTAVPGTTLWGPVAAWYDLDAFTTYARAMGKDRFAGVDWHHYGMGTTSLSTARAMSETPDRGREVREVRRRLRDLGLPDRVNVDELNFSWRYDDGSPGGNQRFFTAVNTVWMTSALGHILSSGGSSMPYATQNGALGVFVEEGGVNPHRRAPSTPMPAHWAMAAWTGAGVWPHMKDAFYSVAAPSGQDHVETFAVNNEAGGRTVVLVNKSESVRTDRRLAFRNAAPGMFSVYQSRASRPYDQPGVIATGTHHGGVDLSLPPMTVTVVVLDPETPADVGGAAPVVHQVCAGAQSVPGWTNGSGLVSGGTTAANTGAVLATAGVPVGVADGERWGEQTWTLPVPAGLPMDVSLYFAERYVPAQRPGQRRFRVAVNGAVVEPDLDVWARGGGHVVTVTSRCEGTTTGRLVVSLTRGSAGEPLINGLVVKAAAQGRCT